MQQKTVFLDLDGTMTDSGQGIINSFNYALGKMGYGDLGDDPNWVVGPSLWESFTRFGLPQDQLDIAVSHYRDCYRGGEMLNNTLYDGILDQMERLKSDGYRLCMATSKPIAYASEITAHFGLDALLDHQFGSELDGTRTDKFDLLTYGLGQTGAQAENAIMVGDRHYDVLGAKQVGMPCLGALYGYGSRDELIAAGAVAVLNTAHDLRYAVQMYLPKGTSYDRH
jgi:phosphoglycolate phosphatase